MSPPPDLRESSDERTFRWGMSHTCRLPRLQLMVSTMHSYQCLQYATFSGYQGRDRSSRL